MAQGESAVLRSVEVVAIEGYFDLAFYKFRVIERQLGALCTQFNIPPTITMRAPAKGDLPFSARENKVSFPVIALDCEVRFPLTPFVRQFLGEAPLHPL